MTFFLWTIAWAQEATYTQFPPDPSIKTCDDLIALNKQFLIDMQTIHQMPESPQKKEKLKESYGRSNTLRSTMKHLESTGVHNQDCKLRLAKSQIDQGVATGSMSKQKGKQAKAAMDIQQLLMQCMNKCASTSGDDVEKKQACMKSCGEEAQKNIPKKE